MTDEPQAVAERREIPEDQFRYRLLLARMHAGNLTTHEAAARAGTTSANWSNWERGVRPRDKVEVANAVAEGLGIDRDWLLYGGPLRGEGESSTGRQRTLDRRKRSQVTSPYLSSAEMAMPDRPSGRAGRHPSPARPVSAPPSGRPVT